MDQKKLEQFKKAAIQQGYKAKDVDAFVQKKAQEQASLELVKRGQMSIEDIAKTNPVGALKLIESGTEIKQPLSAEEKKAEKKLDNADRVISQMEDLYLGKEDLAKGRAGGVISEVKKRIGKNTQLARYEASRDSSKAILARALGEVGNLSGPEQEAILDALPKGTSTIDEAVGFFGDLRERLGLERRTLDSLVDKNQKKKTKVDTKNQTQSVPQDIPGTNILSTIANLGNKAQSASESVANFIAPQTFNKVRETISNPIQTLQKNLTPDVVRAVGNPRQYANDTLSDAKASAEVGSYLVPGGKGIVGLLKSGALSGGLYGASQDAENVGDAATNVVQGATGGGLTAGLFGVGGKLVNKTAEGASGAVKQLFKVPTSKLQEFRRNTGLEFDKEIMRRDIKNIAGKSEDQILEYFKNAYDKVEGSADDFLRTIGKTVNKQQLIDIIDEKIAGLSKNRAGQSPAVSALESFKNDITTQFDDIITLDVANQTKRDAQALASAALGNNGSDSPASNAFAGIQRKISALIEQEAPGFKNVNKDIQYYRLARDSIQKQADKSGQGLISNLLLGGGATGAAIGLSTGNLPIAAASVLPYILRSVLTNPRVQTKTAQAGEKIAQKESPEALRRILQILGARAGGAL